MSSACKPQVVIAGIRGVPARHSGFETFAQVLGPYLAERGWDVVVYCQGEGKGAITEDIWEGVKRIHIPVTSSGAVGTIDFDWRTITDILRRDFRGPVLTFGYNTALFCARLRWARIPNIINMDGIEWRREKWRLHEKAWLWLNDLAGCWIGNHLIADHPEIAKHLARRVPADKISMIPYGADSVVDADPELLRPYALSPARYALVIARPEPENRILEIVRAFSLRRRGIPLVILGNYSPADKRYHADVFNAASDEVRFLGAIFDRKIVSTLRYFARLYVHGHTVGGTNPSLVEALGAGSAVLAHDNRFNRWVAGPEARYFRDEADCAGQLDDLLAPGNALDRMRAASRQRHTEDFRWDGILSRYEELLTAWVAPNA